MKEQTVLQGETLKKNRDSNLELYRIIVMLLIIAHHYVVNSGLTANTYCPNSSTVSGTTASERLVHFPKAA